MVMSFLSLKLREVRCVIHFKKSSIRTLNVYINLNLKTHLMETKFNYRAAVVGNVLRNRMLTLELI